MQYLFSVTSFSKNSFFPLQVEGQLDVVHQYIMQTCGAAMVALAWTRYRSLETRDAYCSVSHIVTRLLVGTLTNCFFQVLRIQTTVRFGKFVEKLAGSADPV